MPCLPGLTAKWSWSLENHTPLDVDAQGRIVRIRRKDMARDDGSCIRAIEAYQLAQRYRQSAIGTRVCDPVVSVPADGVPGATMTKGKRRYLVALVSGDLCMQCRVRMKQVFNPLCWPCERVWYSEWMWTS
jgi:hypothetical protein